MAITDPRDIPGLVVWYSAEAETGYADGAQVTGWTDLSGNGNDAVANGTTKPLWQATTGSGGGASVRFGGAGWFILPDVFSGATSGEMMMSLKSDGAGKSSWAFGDYDGSFASSHYPFSGQVYERFGMTGDAAGSRINFTPTLSITTWHRYNVWSADADQTARIDATVQASITAAVGFPSVPAIGVDAVSGSLRTSMPWLGNLGAVVLYNRKLTTTERSDLDDWLVANPSGGEAPVVNTLDVVAPAATGSLEVASGGTFAILAPAATSTLVVDNAYHTDVTNATNLRQRTMRCGVEITVPVAPVPAGVSEAEQHDAVIAYPLPDMDDGRPT